MTLRATPPTSGGHQPLQVGTKIYGIVPGSQVYRVRRGRAVVAYILDLDGRVRCLIQQGELPLREDLQRLIKAKYFGISTETQYDRDRRAQISEKRFSTKAQRELSRPELSPSAQREHALRAGRT